MLSSKLFPQVEALWRGLTQGHWPLDATQTTPKPASIEEGPRLVGTGATPEHTKQLSLPHPETHEHERARQAVANDIRRHQATAGAMPSPESYGQGLSRFCMTNTWVETIADRLHGSCIRLFSSQVRQGCGDAQLVAWVCWRVGGLRSFVR